MVPGGTGSRSSVRDFFNKPSAGFITTDGSLFVTYVNPVFRVSSDTRIYVNKHPMVINVMKLLDNLNIRSPDIMEHTFFTSY